MRAGKKEEEGRGGVGREGKGAERGREVDLSEDLSNLSLERERGGVEGEEVIIFPKEDRREVKGEGGGRTSIGKGIDEVVLDVFKEGVGERPSEGEVEEESSGRMCKIKSLFL